MPLQVRLFVVLGLAITIAPTLPAPALAADHWAALLKLVAGETFIGLMFGLLGRFAYLALGFIVSAMALATGYGNIPGTAMEPSEPQSALGTFVTFSALLMLFQLDFHHHVIAALAGSYVLMPVGAPIEPAMALADMGATVQASFIVALKIGSPFLVYALVANGTIGIINKLTPQIPVYFVSLPFLLTGGLLLLYATLPTMLMLFATHVVGLYGG